MRGEREGTAHIVWIALLAIGVGLGPVVARADDGLASCGGAGATPDFATRLSDSVRRHLHWDGDDSGTVTRVAGGAEVPESNPPWPYATWNIGGTPAIGVENRYASVLMDALDCGEPGRAFGDSRLTVYGWLQPGFNLSTSRSSFNYSTGTGGNYPSAYSYASNTLQLDQVALYLERTPDEVQREHVDWGFRVTGLYGTDYKYTFTNGVFSNQYLDAGHRMGFDPVMYYVDVWLPRIGLGTNVRIGRYISIPDIEAQLAPNNLTYSHSLLYTVDPYTQHGVVVTTRLNRNWQVQGELNAGNDVAPWVKSERRLTPAACVMWTSDDGRDGIYPCMNGLNDGRWRWNNVQHAVLTWYHKFDSRWHTATEAWYLWQTRVPNVANPDPVTGGAAQIAARYPYVTYGAPSGALCASQTASSCYAYAWALVTYVNYTIGPRDLVTWRGDYLNDARGQRTGFKTRYYETTIGYTHWVGDVIELRPEVRVEFARDIDAYDNPSAIPGRGRHAQATLAVDAILHF